MVGRVIPRTFQAPPGAKESVRSPVLSSLRDSTPPHGTPTVETVGYYQGSLRDIRRQILVTLAPYVSIFGARSSIEPPCHRATMPLLPELVFARPSRGYKQVTPNGVLTPHRAMNGRPAVGIPPVSVRPSPSGASCL